MRRARRSSFSRCCSPARCAGRSRTGASGGTRPGRSATRSSASSTPSPDDATRAVLEPAPWRKTLWYYHAPTNHVAYTVARAALERRLAPAHRRRARRRSTSSRCVSPRSWPRSRRWRSSRVLLARLGFARAAPFAAFLLAVHPLHVRHGAEARGYGFVVLFAIAGAWLLLRALRGGRWRDFLAYGAAQLVLLWTFPLAVYVPLAFAVAGFAAIALGRSWRRADRADARGALPRRQRTRGDGLPRAHGAEPRAGRGLQEGVARRRRARPRLDPPLLGDDRERHAAPRAARRRLLVPDRHEPRGAAALGLADRLRRPAGARGARSRARARAAGGGRAGGVDRPRRLDRPLPPAPRAPGVLPAAALRDLRAARVPRAARGRPGGDRVGGDRAPPPPRARRGRAARRSRSRASSCWSRPRCTCCTAGPRPRRPSSSPSSRSRTAGPRGALRAGIGLGGDAPRVYDPHIVEVENLAQLEALCARARGEGLPLYVFYAFTTVNMKRLPEVFMHIRDTGEFEPIATLPGIDPDMVIHVRRYTGQPVRWGLLSRQRERGSWAGVSKRDRTPPAPFACGSASSLGAALLALSAWLAGPLAPWRSPRRADARPEARTEPHPHRARRRSGLGGGGERRALRAAPRDVARVGAAGARGRCPGWTPVRVGRAALLLFAAAAALAGALRWPLATGSLWWDEAWSVRYTIVGKVEPVADRSETRVPAGPVARHALVLPHADEPRRLQRRGARRRTARGAHSRAAPRRRSTSARSASRRSLAAIAAVVATRLPGPRARLSARPRRPRRSSSRSTRGTCATAPTGAATASSCSRPRWPRSSCSARSARTAGATGSARARRTRRSSGRFRSRCTCPLALAGAAAFAIALGPREARGPARAARASRRLLAAMAYLQVMAPNLAQAVRLERLLGEEAKLDGRLAWNVFVAATTGLPLRMPQAPRRRAFRRSRRRPRRCSSLPPCSCPRSSPSGASRALRRDAAGARRRARPRRGAGPPAAAPRDRRLLPLPPLRDLRARAGDRAPRDRPRGARCARRRADRSARGGWCRPGSAGGLAAYQLALCAADARAAAPPAGAGARDRGVRPRRGRGRAARRDRASESGSAGTSRASTTPGSSRSRSAASSPPSSRARRPKAAALRVLRTRRAEPQAVPRDARAARRPRALRAGRALRRHRGRARLPRPPLDRRADVGRTVGCASWTRRFSRSGACSRSRGSCSRSPSCRSRRRTGGRATATRASSPRCSRCRSPLPGRLAHGAAGAHELLEKAHEYVSFIAAARLALRRSPAASTSAARSRARRSLNTALLGARRACSRT